MNARVLLDTHILIRWIEQPEKLSKDQLRSLRNAARQYTPLGVSAITLVELAQLSQMKKSRQGSGANQILDLIQIGSTIEVFPITVLIAREASVISPVLRDPMDSVIVATARIHGLKLLTADDRIIDSRLAVTIE